MSTKQPKRKQLHYPPSDYLDWERFCIATLGGPDLCAACPATGVRPEKGHIVPRAQCEAQKRLFDDWDNRIPLCSTCNKKCRRKAPLDTRLPGWERRFFFAQMGVLLPKVWLRAIEPPSHPDENTFVIEYPDRAILMPQNGVSEPLKATRRPTQMEAAKAVTEAERLSLHGPASFGEHFLAQIEYVMPRSPDEKERPAMLAFCMANDDETFIGAAKEFLKLGSWIKWERTGEDTGRAVAVWHSWADFVNGFDKHVELRRQYLERQRLRKEKEAREEAERKTRAIREVLRIPDDSPVWTDEARQYRERIAAGEEPPDAEARSEALVKAHWEPIHRKRAEEAREKEHWARAYKVQADVFKLIAAFQEQVGDDEFNENWVHFFYAARNFREKCKSVEDAIPYLQKVGGEVMRTRYLVERGTYVSPNANLGPDEFLRLGADTPDGSSEEIHQ